MKKLTILLLCFSLLLGGCGTKPEPSLPVDTSSAEETPKETIPQEETLSMPVVINKPFPQAINFENCINE
jgi:hypothetical protein